MFNLITTIADQSNWRFEDGIAIWVGDKQIWESARQVIEDINLSRKIKSKKIKRKELLRKQKLEEEYPNTCFCEIEHNFSNDEFIEERNVDQYHNIFTGFQIVKLRFYRCPQCGKEYDDDPRICFA